MYTPSLLGCEGGFITILRPLKYKKLPWKRLRDLNPKNM
jgi:hypothetical protein